MKRLRFCSLEIRSFHDGRFQAAFEAFAPGLNAILGPNASGKSTLALAAMRILSPELAKGKDRVCAELLLEDDGAETAYHADVDRKTKDGDWPQSLRPGLYRLALDDLITGPGTDDTRVIREAFAGGVDLRALFPYVNKRAPSLAGIANGIAEREQEAARIAGEEARSEVLAAQRENLRRRIEMRTQLGVLRESRQAALRAENLHEEQQALLRLHPGIDRQPEDAQSRAGQARERHRRLCEEHQDSLRRLAPHGGSPAPAPLPATVRARLQTLQTDLTQLRKTRDREEAEHHARLRAAEQRLEEARARLSRWELTLPENYSPADETGILRLLDHEHLPGQQDKLREELAQKHALETEAALREAAPVFPGQSLTLTAAATSLSLLGYSLYTHLNAEPQAPYLFSLSLGILILTLAMVLLRTRVLGNQREDVRRLRSQAAAINPAPLQENLQRLLQAFQETTGLQIDSAYSLDLATRRAREVCEARLALNRAHEEHQRLLQPPAAEPEAPFEVLEAEIASLFDQYGQARLRPASGRASETLSVFLEYFDLSEQTRRAEQRAHEAETDLHELLDSFGIPPGETATRMDTLRERIPAAKEYRKRETEYSLAKNTAETLSGQLTISPERLNELGLSPRAAPAEIQAVLEPLEGLESELETLDKTLSDIRTRVGVLEAGGGGDLSDYSARIEEAGTFLQSFIERRAGFLVREALEEAVRRENTPEVIRGLETWLGRFTDGRYSRPEVHDGRLVIHDTRVNGEPYPPEQLSTGTRVHLALAVRLAVIETTETRGIRFPLFLDDILAVSDPEARQALLRAVRELETERQIFLLTSRPDDLTGLDAKSFSLQEA